ncbi:efflux RND transporter periplasmic adaptor subunit [Alkaliphilus crotonatoxidans]
MKKKIIGIIVAVAVLGTAGYYLFTQNTAITVTTAPVNQGSIEKYVEELGVVMTERRETVYAAATGRVTDVLVNIGDSVQKGELLLKIEEQQLLREIQGIEAQEAALQAQYQEALKPVDQREIERLKLELTNQENALVEAERTTENQKKLYEAGAVSHEDYQNALNQLEAQRNNLEKLSLELEILSNPHTINIAAQYQAQLKQLAIQKEALESQKEEYSIASPIEGTIMLKNIEKGSYLQPGMQLFEIGSPDNHYIEADILVSDIANVNEGDKVLISHQNLGIELTGTVRKIHPQAFSKISDLGIEQKRIKVEIEIQGREANLRPGYDLDIKIVTEERDKTLIIPENALFQQENQYYVYVKKNNRAVLREVQTGIESQKQVEIISGLMEGERLILSSNEELKDGAKIKE